MEDNSKRRRRELAYIDTANVIEEQQATGTRGGHDFRERRKKATQVIAENLLTENLCLKQESKVRQKVQQKLQESFFVPKAPESLDALNIPPNLVSAPELKVYEEMRGVELSLNEFLA